MVIWDMLKRASTSSGFTPPMTTGASTQRLFGELRTLIKVREIESSIRFIEFICFMSVHACRQSHNAVL